ncbi:MAG: hypothetical protein MJY72_05205 [Bacteroidales bacterium]|nr:hypothetical protein [Bacteroidales bacterium]
MKEILGKIARFLKLDRGDMPVFLASLLLALSIWFIHNLALKYTDFVSVQVVAKSSIEGHAELSTNSAEVVARARCIGFNIVKMKLRHSERVLSVHDEDFHHLSGDTYYLTSKELMGFSHELFGEGSVVEYFVTDTVTFRFAPVSHRKVPVVLNGSFETESGYMFKDGVKLSPDSVTVYGEMSRLSTIGEILTTKFYKSGISNDGQGVLKLSKIKGMRLSDDEVRYTYSAVRYVDIPFSSDIQIVNKPIDKKLVVVPSSADIRFRCAFPLVADPTVSAVLYVDYEDYLDSRSGKCPVKLRVKDTGVIDYTIDPMYVEVFEQ